jgi:transketolase
VRNVSHLGDIEAKFRAFGWHVARCDGHDVAALERTFRALDDVEDLPKVIIADTVKGKASPSWKARRLRRTSCTGITPVPR